VNYFWSIILLLFNGVSWKVRIFHGNGHAVQTHGSIRVGINRNICLTEFLSCISWEICKKNSFIFPLFVVSLKDKKIFWFHSDYLLHWLYIPLTVWFCLLLLSYIIFKMQFLIISIFVLLDNTSNIRCTVWPLRTQSIYFFKTIIELNSQKWISCYRKRRLTESGFFLIKFKVCKSVQHRKIQINHQPDATIFQFIILTFI